MYFNSFFSCFTYSLISCTYINKNHMIYLFLDCVFDAGIVVTTEVRVPWGKGEGKVRVPGTLV